MIRAYLFGIGLIAASGTNAQLPAVSPGALVAATKDCAAAATNKTVDGATLEARGWKTASISGVEPAEVPFIYGKSEGGPILMVSPPDVGSAQLCILTGSLKSQSDFKRIAKAFESEFTPAGEKANDRYFRIGSDTAVLTPTGSRSKPSFRVAVLELGVSE